MRTFKVIALSCNSKRGILNSGDTVTEDAFGEGEANQLVTDGFLEEVKESPKKEPVKEKPEGKKKKGGLLETLSTAAGV